MAGDLRPRHRVETPPPAEEPIENLARRENSANTPRPVNKRGVERPQADGAEAAASQSRLLILAPPNETFDNKPELVCTNAISGLGQCNAIAFHCPALRLHQVVNVGPAVLRDHLEGLLATISPTIKILRYRINGPK